jgi:hypothetical protein
MVTSMSADVEYVATQIGACSTADDLAAAARIVQFAAASLADEELAACYRLIRQRVVSLAGITDEYESYVDEAIMAIYG